jgi:hypothetical protein
MKLGEFHGAALMLRIRQLHDFGVSSMLNQMRDQANARWGEKPDCFFAAPITA